MTIHTIGNSEKMNHPIRPMSATTGPIPIRFWPGRSSLRPGLNLVRFMVLRLRSGSSTLRLAEHAHQVARGDEHDDPEQQHICTATGVVQVDDRVLERADL